MDRDINIQVLPRWLSKKLAAQYCCCSTKTIERWVNSGKLSITRINGGHYKVDQKELDRILEQNKVRM